ncbi:MAG: cupin domain-containing protein [Ilumatobacteraceae bacterium]|jgi:quercetin dioxygenase-like cupin family protein
MQKSSTLFPTKLVFFFAICGLLPAVASCSNSTPGEIGSEILLNKEAKTILEESFNYPVTDSPEVSSSIITLPPGAQTGWHLHEAPMYAYVLEGTLEVTYKLDGTEKRNVYKKGEAIMEGLYTPHNGVNNTSKPVRILVVNFGSRDLDNSVKL